MNLLPGADLAALQQLPHLAPGDRAVLERLIIMSPETAVATASAILRTHQGDLHDLFFPKEQNRRGRTGRLAAALVYLALATSAPAQGKFMPMLSERDFRVARHTARQLLALRASGEMVAELADLIADEELAKLLETFVERWSARRTNLDPRWVRATVATQAGAFYMVLGKVSGEQFQATVDVEAAAIQLTRAARSRELLIDALGPEEELKAFDQARQLEQIERLKEFGWQEYLASEGRTMAGIAPEAEAAGLTSETQFVLTEEWHDHGASRATDGGRYFMRPGLLPDSEGLSLSANQERLKPLQRILAGDPSETGLLLGMGTVELLLEYLLQSKDREFLVGRWTRTDNQYDKLHTRFGLIASDRFAVTLFPASRRDMAVGIWPVIRVERGDLLA